MNQVNLIGYIEEPPKFGSAKEGSLSTANFLLRVYPDKRASEREPDIIPCVAWNTAAWWIHKYVRRGHKVRVTGRLRVDRWDVEGKQYVDFVVVADVVELVGTHLPQKYKEEKQ